VGRLLAKPAAGGTGTNFEKKSGDFGTRSEKEVEAHLNRHTHHTSWGLDLGANWELVLVQLLATKPNPVTLFFTYNSQFIFYQVEVEGHNSILSDDSVLRKCAEYGPLCPTRSLCVCGIQGSLNFQTPVRASKWVHNITNWLVMDMLHSVIVMWPKLRSGYIQRKPSIVGIITTEFGTLMQFQGAG
jgi:hypothetical protein